MLKALDFGDRRMTRLGIQDALSRNGLADALQLAEEVSPAPASAARALGVLRRALADACGMTLLELQYHARARQLQRDGAGDDGALPPIEQVQDQAAAMVQARAPAATSREE